MSLGFGGRAARVFQALATPRVGQSRCSRPKARRHGLPGPKPDGRGDRREPRPEPVSERYRVIVNLETTRKQLEAIQVQPDGSWQRTRNSAKQFTTVGSRDDFAYARLLIWLKTCEEDFDTGGVGEACMSVEAA